MTTLQLVAFIENIPLTTL